jgi:hypothetical protein
MGPLGSLLLRPQLQRATLSRGNGLWASSRCNSRYSGCIGLSRRSFSVTLALPACAPGCGPGSSSCGGGGPPGLIRLGLALFGCNGRRAAVAPSRASRRAWLATERRQTCMLREAAAAPEAPGPARPAPGRVVSGAAADGRGTAAREQTCVM